MIIYDHKNAGLLRKLVVLDGSVFPSALLVAIPCSLLAVGLRAWIDAGGSFLAAEDILKETQVWSGFTFLVGFLIVFRTSQAYARFWDGCTATHNMRAEWLDGVSALCAFVEFSNGRVARDKQVVFKAKLIRLVSMLHSAALAELEVMGLDFPRFQEVAAFKYEIIDPGGLDEKSLRLVQQSKTKVQLLYGWIQCLIVQNIQEGVLTIPAPLLSRAFQELANGMVAFHEAMKISAIPFPFPYTQTCDCLLFMHFIITPIVTCQWVNSLAWAGVFVFIQVFVLWALNFTAIEIENPFGVDPNDLDGRTMQMAMNQNLLLMLRSNATRTPHLQDNYTCNEAAEGGEFLLKSFHDVWSDSPEMTRVGSTETGGVDARKTGCARSLLACLGKSGVRRNPANDRWYQQQEEEPVSPHLPEHPHEKKFASWRGSGDSREASPTDQGVHHRHHFSLSSSAMATFGSQTSTEGHLHALGLDVDAFRSLARIFNRRSSHAEPTSIDEHHTCTNCDAWVEHAYQLHHIPHSHNGPEVWLCNNCYASSGHQQHHPLVGSSSSTAFSSQQARSSRDRGNGFSSSDREAQTKLVLATLSSDAFGRVTSSNSEANGLLTCNGSIAEEELESDLNPQSTDAQQTPQAREDLAAQAASNLAGGVARKKPPKSVFL
mmetsp:Transcript_814/g.1784  ORF Transcript_814/g.1784 Transcript_814/m.1784 type:complete len:659 (+) Transcript_814:175-2151(+)